MVEFADSSVVRRTVRVRCIEPTFCGYGHHGMIGEEVQGCGWNGQTMAESQYGVATLAIDDCPECGGRIEVKES